MEMAMVEQGQDHWRWREGSVGGGPWVRAVLEGTKRNSQEWSKADRENSGVKWG